jgi:transcriptional regulator with XRE-family HTH domain
MVSGSVGERIAAYRRRRGLSQAALAALIGRSESWLSQVERGIRSADRWSVLMDMARVLHVDVEALTGSVRQQAPQDTTTPADLRAVRRHFARYDHLAREDKGSAATAASLGSAAAKMHTDYQAAKYRLVITRLPSLLASADSIRPLRGREDRADALAGHLAAYLVAAKLLTKMGVEDLALIAADRCATAAQELDSPEGRALAAYQVVCAALRARRPDDAENLAVTVAEGVRVKSDSNALTLASAVGSLWLIAAVIAARRLDRVEASRRLAIAETLAYRVGRDANLGWTAFGPTNVAIHRVSVAAELGDAGAALEAADAVNLTALPAGLRSRRAQVLLDLAWAQAHRKRDAEAVLHLLEAERIAPDAIRYNVAVRELVRDLLARTRRPSTTALHELAVRAGVID